MMSDEQDAKTTSDPLKSIAVLGLFSVFDHRIEFLPNSSVTVIHGSNGVGKTIVLRMIREALTGDTEIIHRIPFQRFELTFASGDSLVFKKSDSSDNSVVEYAMNIGHEKFNGVYQHTELPQQRIVQLLDRNGGDWMSIDENKFRDRVDGEIIDRDTAIKRVASHIGRGDTADQTNHDLRSIQSKCNVRLIGTDRLTDSKLVPNTRRGPRRRRPSDENRTIGRYSLDLVNRINLALFEYGKLTERLDRSTVKRMVAKDFKRTSAEEVLQEFKQLDAKRRELTDLGLLTESEDVIWSEGDADVLELIRGRLDVFSIYVNDMRQKLSIFDELGEKLRILLERTRLRFQFKSLAIDSERGLVFKSQSGSTLDVSDLSSGEQHEMIFFYDLLFFASSEDLILIDEPEISLHLEWQMEFMKDLKAALKSSNAHVLVATHSPAIAEAAGDSLIELAG